MTELEWLIQDKLWYEQYTDQDSDQDEERNWPYVAKDERWNNNWF